MRDYVLSLVPAGLVLVHCNSEGERILWVEVSDSLNWRGYISSDSRVSESVAEILKLDGIA
jgi:hypothetical protein